MHVALLMLAALFGGSLLSPIALAAGVPVTDELPMRLAEVRRGSLMFRTAQTGQYLPAPLLSSDVRIRVTGPIARTVLTQTFQNPAQAWAEAIYAFPLPETAAVDHLRMRIGERVVEGEIQEKKTARKTYEAARSAGQRSVLVEQHRPNLFTTEVANIAPQSEIQIEIEYQQELRWRDGQFSLRFPMAITPRFNPRATGLEQNLGTINGWALLPGELPNAVGMSPASAAQDETTKPVNLNPTRLSIDLQPGFALASIDSPYHPIQEQWQGDRVIVTLADQTTAADRDFELRWRPTPASEPQAAYFIESGPEGDYGLLMLMPPQDGFAQRHARPREMILIIDTSGSMGGEPIRAARAALLNALATLQPEDHFNLIEFSSRARALFPQAMPADPTNLRQAKEFTQALRAGGGTQMRPALELGLAQSDPEAEPRLRQIVFITDGAVSNEAELMSLIHQRLGQSRLFTVGIGSAPNAHFMTEAAHFGRGSFSYVANAAEVEVAMKLLLRQIARPALTDLKLQLPVPADAFPDPLPDVYLAEPIHVVMQFPQPPENAELIGRIGQHPWTRRLELHGGSQQRGISVLWARRKIAYWNRQARQGLPEELLRSEVQKLGLKHHLVSAYTSLVAVDRTPARNPELQSLKPHALDGNLPAGMQPQAQAQLARGATAASLFISIGLMMLLGGLLMHRGTTQR